MRYVKMVFHLQYSDILLYRSLKHHHTAYSSGRTCNMYIYLREYTLHACVHVYWTMQRLHDSCITHTLMLTHGQVKLQSCLELLTINAPLSPHTQSITEIYNPWHSLKHHVTFCTHSLQHPSTNCPVITK